MKDLLYVLAFTFLVGVLALSVGAVASPQTSKVDLKAVQLPPTHFNSSGQLTALGGSKIIVGGSGFSGALNLVGVSGVSFVDASAITYVNNSANGSADLEIPAGDIHALTSIGGGIVNIGDVSKLTNGLSSEIDLTSIGDLSYGSETPGFNSVLEIETTGTSLDLSGTYLTATTASSYQSDGGAAIISVVGSSLTTAAFHIYLNDNSTYDIGGYFSCANCTALANVTLFEFGIGSNSYASYNVNFSYDALTQSSEDTILSAIDGAVSDAGGSFEGTLNFQGGANAHFSTASEGYATDLASYGFNVQSN